MLNVNSPTVQAMLSNTPQGMGNIPVYYGNTPSIEQQTMQVPSTPFPSPKEMLIQGGQSAVYNPTYFAPRNIVGAYNPGFETAFQNYYNPYMGYGYNMYNPYYGGYGYYQMPLDQETRDTLEVATANGLTYEEQINSESKLLKTISRIVSKNVGRTEEETKRCEEAFDVYNKNKQAEQREEYKPIKILKTKLVRGDEVIAYCTPEVSIRREGENYSRNGSIAEQMSQRQSAIEAQMVNIRNQMYDRAPERMFDNMNLLDFFNNGAGVLMADTLNRILYSQSIGRTSQVYDRNNFRKRLLENNGYKTRDELSAVERFAGRYGVMPDGRPVSPGHDPAVASSFSYDPKTGQYSVTAPNFISDRLERARQSFIRSIDESNN